MKSQSQSFEEHSSVDQFDANETPTSSLEKVREVLQRFSMITLKIPQNIIESALSSPPPTQTKNSTAIHQKSPLASVENEWTRNHSIIPYQEVPNWIDILESSQRIPSLAFLLDIPTPTVNPLLDEPTKLSSSLMGPLQGNSLPYLNESSSLTPEILESHDNVSSRLSESQSVLNSLDNLVLHEDRYQDPHNQIEHSAQDEKPMTLFSFMTTDPVTSPDAACTTDDMTLHSAHLKRRKSLYKWLVTGKETEGSDAAAITARKVQFFL